MNPKKVDAGFLLCLVAVFCWQTYLVFARFIPDSLAPYAEAPEIQAYVKSVVVFFVNLTFVWFFLAILGPAVRLLSSIAAQKRAGSSNSI